MSKSDQNHELKNLQPMFVWVVIAGIIVVMATMVWPIWNLLPQYVTEQVKVVSVDQSGVWADTQDNYLVKLVGSYNHIQPGDHIMGTYDVNVKQRIHTFAP